MRASLRFALYEPDIPQNVGAIVRLAAGLGCPVELIEPLGFVFDRRKLGRAALDYHDRAEITRQPSWRRFDAVRRAHGRRLVLLTTHGATDYRDLTYGADDVLLVGAESAGVPDQVHAAADRRVVIPLAAGVRSLNVVTALAMVAGEALRQLRAAEPTRSDG
ncbi:MAG: tRNA methyltransferase [Alphaproteobacteria bacterium]|jgi:tRNA (cytidine/uridine-2'-O-)-methyltransferase|nr:tRNA methyltransferase [Alphaproteobacteria bacterium]